MTNQITASASTFAHFSYISSEVTNHLNCIFVAAVWQQLNKLSIPESDNRTKRLINSPNKNWMSACQLTLDLTHIAQKKSRICLFHSLHFFPVRRRASTCFRDSLCSIECFYVQYQVNLTRYCTDKVFDRAPMLLSQLYCARVCTHLACTLQKKAHYKNEKKMIPDQLVTG